METHTFTESVIIACEKVRRSHGDDVAQSTAERVLRAGAGGSWIAKGSLREVERYCFSVAPTTIVDARRREGRSLPLAPAGFYTCPTDPMSANRRRWSGVAWTSEVLSPSGEAIDSTPPAGLRPQHVLTESIDAQYWGDGAETIDPPDAGDSVEAQALRVALVHSLLAILPPEDATLLRESWIEERTDAEIALDLGITETAARSRVHRALLRAQETCRGLG